MMELDISFEPEPWEQAMEQLAPGGNISAAKLLALLEDSCEEALEDAFAVLDAKRIALDISDLPAPNLQTEAAVRLQQEQILSKQADMIQGLEENDPLRLYLQELAGIPVTGEYRVLAAELMEGKERAGEKLADLSLPRVIELAKELTGHGVLLLDLIQEGSLGLWQGILCYEGGDFETHRDWWIRQYLHKAVTVQARSGGIGQKLRQGMADYRDTDQRLLMELGRNPTVEEIAQAMHIADAEAVVYADMLRSARAHKQVEEARQPAVEPQEEDQAVENTAYFQMRQRITELLSAVSEREASVLTLRFGLEGGLPLSPEDTAKQLGMCVQEVLAAEAAALAKLRQEK